MSSENKSEYTNSTINEIEPIYFLNEHNVDTEVFFPAFSSASSVDCMMGYFSSESLRDLAVSLSHFLRSNQFQIRLIISPNLSKKDLDALQEAAKLDKNLVHFLFPGFELTEDCLRTRCVAALSYLVASNRLVFRIALQKKGLFHTKCWIFKTYTGWMTIHGSANLTGAGLSANTEQITIDKEWEDSRSKKVVDKIRDTFFALWKGGYKNIVTIELNRTTLKYLKEVNEKTANLVEHPNYLNEKFLEELNNTAITPRKLTVPNWLNYQSGEFSHQGEAISAWVKEGRGILSIATGGGKTLTSLVAACLVTQKEEKLLVVVAVPTVALLSQWAENIRSFQVEPLMSEKRSVAKLKQDLRGRIRKMRHGASINEVIVVTHESLKSDLADALQQISCELPVMLIGDEVHNLGSDGFQKARKPDFRYRMGLSATYERQFDEQGTKFLLDYFGNVVYEFPLSKAIGKCLVNYDYFVHRVFLNAEEQDEWTDLTVQIGKLSYTSDYPDGDPQKERWKRLCLKRRKVIESAEGKMRKFSSILPQERRAVKRTLVFCTDKYPAQILELNKILQDRLVNFHQVTQAETQNTSMLAKIVSSYASGELQVLTSKRVLDEGFDAPQTETAYFIASNTVRRQWIQRLGRILRLSPATKKTKATLHDFVVLPCVGSEKPDSDFKQLIQGEFDRVGFFPNFVQTD